MMTSQSANGPPSHTRGIFQLSSSARTERPEFERSEHSSRTNPQTSSSAYKAWEKDFHAFEDKLNEKCNKVPPGTGVFERNPFTQGPKIRKVKNCVLFHAPKLIASAPGQGDREKVEDLVLDAEDKIRKLDVVDPYGLSTLMVTPVWLRKLLDRLR